MFVSMVTILHITNTPLSHKVCNNFPITFDEDGG